MRSPTLILVSSVKFLVGFDTSALAGVSEPLLQLIPLQGREPRKPHVEDRIGLDLTQPETVLQALGRLGIAIVENFEIEHVMTSPYEDWHGASLGPRKGASDEAHLYRVIR